MILRRKVLYTTIILTAINMLIAVFWIEAVYLVGGEFDPRTDQDLMAPYFWKMTVGVVFLVALTGTLVYWLAVRNIILPLAGIADSAEKIEAGENVVMRGINRQDEVGRIAAAFNQLSSRAAAARDAVERKIDAAVAEAESSRDLLATAERYAASGRLAGKIVEQLSANLNEASEAIAVLKKRDVSDETKAGQIAVVEDCLRELRDSIRGVFDLARRGKDVRPTSVSEALGAALDICRHLFDKYRIALVEEIEEPGRNGEDKLTVAADAGDLLHVFMNLILNAVDAMPRGGVLTVRASRVLKWVLVEIVDTGVGLTIDEVSASFDFFHSSKRHADNAGLGLSVSRHIVVDYGGALTLNSRKGEGTKATVELPAVSPAVFHSKRHTRRAGGARNVRNAGALGKSDRY